MPRNEAQTRFELIDPALEDRGWNRRTDIRVEETAKPIDIINHQPRERATGRTDDVLRRPLTPGAEPVPLAIMEATRIDRASGKPMFRIFDYTGATALFGEPFVTPPPPEPGPPQPPAPPGPPVQKVRVKGVAIEIKDTGRFNLLTRDGRLHRVAPQEYREELTRQLIAAVPTLADFRARWLHPDQRQEMLKELRDQNLLPEVVSEGADMEAFDEFDILATLAYGVKPMTRAERATRFADTGPAWLIQLPPPTAKVIRKIVKQFEKAGTGALETGQLWKTIDEPHALDTLRQGGEPAELLRKTKETLFAA